MSSLKNIVLVACGSFNPPTYLHLRMFELARDFLHSTGSCRVVAGVLSPVHDAYAKKELASSADRCEMVRRVVASSSWLHLSDWEALVQSHWTPTRQVLQYHQDALNSLRPSAGEQNGVTSSHEPTVSRGGWLDTVAGLCMHDVVHVRLLCGGDLLESFCRPGLWSSEDLEQIMSRFCPVVIERKGSVDPRSISSQLNLIKQHTVDVVSEWVSNDVSSTLLRRAVARGESVRYLTADSVIEYINSQHLYSAQDRPKAASIQQQQQQPQRDSNNEPCANINNSH